MKYDIRLLKQEEYKLLDTLCKDADASFPPFLDSEYLAARNGDARLLGAIGFYTSGRHPSFQHLILSKTAPRKLGALLIRRLESLLKERGFSLYCVYVENTKNWLQQIALKYGYTPYNQDADGVWYFKNI